MDTTAAQDAIKSALNGDWDNAIEQNLSILKLHPEDLDSLNRLARAYAETGKYTKAREFATKTIKIDPTNIIANKMLDKWKNMTDGLQDNTRTSGIKESFLEDPGKTKLISLINPGDESLISKLDSGDELNILCHTHKVSVTTTDKKYVGKLPDDISMKIRSLSKIGFKYNVMVKSVSGRDVVVFIREIERPEGKHDIISFPVDKLDYVSYTAPELVHREDLDMGNSDETHEDIE